MVLDMDNTIMASLPDKMGRGIYYWEPLCIPRGDEGGWAENMGILDERGQARRQFIPLICNEVMQS